MPNPEGELPSGVTSEIRIPIKAEKAHFLSPALLSLNDEGVFGVKLVNDDGIVEFHPARIVKSVAAGVWLSGLPDTVRLITVGQGFVRQGDRVKAVPEESIKGTDTAVRQPG